MFEILAIGNKEVESLPTGYRVLDGLFQALGMPLYELFIEVNVANLSCSAVRAGGFYVVTISELRQGLLVLYVLMMVILYHKYQISTLTLLTQPDSMSQHIRS